MAHLLQVGCGSGGMVVLDLLARDPKITKITLIEPDTYKLHNVYRHYFPAGDVGQKKIDLAVRWVQERRPDLELVPLAIDLLDPKEQAQIEAILPTIDLGVCAVDNEPAKYHFDQLLRKYNKPWTMGEVLSGGIGGWLHHFTPDGPCYGCVASHLQRNIETDNRPAPDYSNPNGAVAETTVPASKAAIEVIASLHAVLTLQRLEGSDFDPGFTSLLWTLQKVEGVFPEPYRPYRFRITKAPDCLICGSAHQQAPTGEALDVALAKALARLGDE